MYRNFTISVLLIGFSLLFSACHATKTPSVRQVQQNGNLCEKYHFLKTYQCSFDQVQLAARNGDANAQYILGYLYYYGIGVMSNDKLALKWITEAAKKGNPSAKNALTLLQPNQNTKAFASMPTSICKDSRGYTIQIAGSYSLSKLREFMQTNQRYFDMNTFIFHRTLNNAPWYILAYGQYSTYGKAQQTLYRLPAALNSYQPWVKSCASLASSR